LILQGEHARAFCEASELREVSALRHFVGDHGEPFVVGEASPGDEREPAVGSARASHIRECRYWVVEEHESELADHQIERVGWERVGLGVGDNKLNVVNARCASPLRRHVR
jgi:hypothetical protein